MSDEYYHPPFLKIKEVRHNPASRTVWIEVEGFRSMDLGIDKGDMLYILREQDIEWFVNELNNLRHNNAALREKLNEYKEYFELQKKLQEVKE